MLPNLVLWQSLILLKIHEHFTLMLQKVHLNLLRVIVAEGKQASWRKPPPLETAYEGSPQI